MRKILFSFLSVHFHQKVDSGLGWGVGGGNGMSFFSYFALRNSLSKGTTTPWLPFFLFFAAYNVRTVEWELKDNYAHELLVVIGSAPLLYSQQRQLSTCYIEGKNTAKEGRMMAVWRGGGVGVDPSLSKGPPVWFFHSLFYNLQYVAYYELFNNEKNF